MKVRYPASIHFNDSIVNRYCGCPDPVRDFSIKSATPSVVAAALLCLSMLITSQPAQADVWVFEPSVGVDQRLDDNFTLNPFNNEPIATTRAVASAKISRESETYFFLGQGRIDGLLSIDDDDTNELTSNQILFFDSGLLRPRSKWGLEFTLKRDTPSRDILSDLTDLSQTAADTGASVTQDQNVDRTRFVLSPSFEYNLSRRSVISFGYTFTQVNHGKPSVQDAIDRQVLELLANDATTPERFAELSALDGNATINDVGRFTVGDELDDFTENLVEFRFRHELSRVDRFSLLLSYSAFEAQSEMAADEVDRIPDPREDDILRNPRADTTTDTARFSFGYERNFSPTFLAGVQAGYFTARTDTFGVTETNDGYTAAVNASLVNGLDTFSAKFGIEIFPSDIGEVVESLELIADYGRPITRLLEFSFRFRAFEPDAISDLNDADRFARRFISLEPKIVWNFKRAWAFGASYRYRRQKSQVDPATGDSNALLFSINYTHPSAVADARRQEQGEAK